MKIEYFLLAEGIGVDAGGVVTAIGLNRNVFAPPVLPATTKRAMCVNLRETESSPHVPGSQITVGMRVSSPSGRTLSATSQQLMLGEKPFPSLPASMLIPAEVRLTVEEYGVHEIVAEVREGERVEQARIELYVVEPEANS